MPDVSELNRQVEAGRSPATFILAMMLATFKDFIDVVFVSLKGLLGFTGFGIAIALPLVIITWAISLFLAVFIYFMLRNQGWLTGIKSRIYFGLFAVIIGSLPIVSALPITSIFVYWKWHSVKKRAELAERRLNMF